MPGQCPGQSHRGSTPQVGIGAVALAYTGQVGVGTSRVITCHQSGKRVQYSREFHV